ncbi:MAG TPA: hypothetical protein VGG46_13370 [Terriglobales bacterium]|jgi:hypothetical protein
MWKAGASNKKPSGNPVPDLMEWDIFLPHVLMCLKKAHRMNAKTGCQRFADFSVTDGGTVYLFQPLTEDARQWLAEHCPLDDEHQYFGNALVIEPRYLANIVELAIRDGLTPLATGKEAA